MTKHALTMIAALVLSTSAGFAQDVTPTDDDDTAVVLPAVGDVENFLPFIAPFAAGIGIVAAAAGGNSTTSTTSTTSTN